MDKEIPGKGKIMRSRNRKAISLVLIASMVFTMNTVAFAENIPADGAYEVSEAAGTENSHIEEHDGIYYRYNDAEGSEEYEGSDRTPLTTITYETDKTDKKSREPNVATITNTTVLFRGTISMQRL